MTLAVWTGACAEERLGDACEEDESCPSGTGCYLPAGSEAGVCTVSCESDTCTSGTCTATKDGPACTRECEFIADCDSDAPCQIDSLEQSVCWVDDPRMTPVPDGVIVASVVASWDGSPYQQPQRTLELSRDVRFVSFDVFVRNAASRDIHGVWLQPVALNDGIVIGGCHAQSLSYGNEACATGCNCEGVLSPPLTLRGETSPYEPVLSMNVTIADDARLGTHRFGVTIHDDTGASWESGFTVELVQ